MPDDFTQDIRRQLAEGGYEFTPDEVDESLAEAHERIRPGPDGCCIKCGHDGSDGRDFRFGLCEVCAFCKAEDCLEPPGDDGYCPLHRVKDAEEQV